MEKHLPFISYKNKIQGAADVIGIAYPTASVTANGASAYRKGEYFWKELSLDNASAPLWTNIIVVASLSGTNQTNSGYLFLPKATELYTYDADGNLTSDGRWTNRWDAENRLLEMESLPSAPAGSGVKMQFAYDYQSRRTSKVLSNWNGSAWQLGTNLHFLYDGWNLLAELNATNGLERSYLWGLDLSGSPQGAGGVGGLLAVSTFNSKPSTCFYAYDGNGNVRGMIDGKDGNPAARYDTGPFAEPVRSSGAMAAANPIRFSTKYQDGDSEFLYYGYRFYNSQAGRWINRDPIAERGGLNLNAMLDNAPIVKLDVLGHGCLVNFECSLRSQTPEGNCNSHCEYVCREKHREDRKGLSALTCADLPSSITTTTGTTASGNILCDLTGGSCGRRGVCQNPITMNRLYDDISLPDRNCSRQACIDGCSEIADRAQSACDLIKEPLAKQLCNQAVERARSLCIDGCNAWCRNP